MNNFDLNKILSLISKMDKKELEENITKAKSILDNSSGLNNINNLENLSKQINLENTQNMNKNNNSKEQSWGDIWMKITLI